MTKKLIKIDKNGTKYYRERVPCWRCGNIAGGLYIVGTNNGQLVPSGLDNGICWKCHGDGYIWETTKEYTPEHLAKLEKERARRAAKREAENAAKAAEINAEKERKERERAEAIAAQIAEHDAKAAESKRSHYVGKIGDKIEFTATVKRSFSYEKSGFYDWQTIIAYIHEFVDCDGNVFIWYSSAFIEAKEGDTVNVRGTIKNHSEYTNNNYRVYDINGAELPRITTKQTVLTRCKVIKVETQEPEPAPVEIPENAQILHLRYSQYKEHYADCKTVPNSYNENTGCVDVIVPEGRMKKSGVRGERFDRYRYQWTDGNTGEKCVSVYTAVNEENARKHLLKDFPQAVEIEILNIYFSGT